jgi:hypothetical protein
MNLPPAVFSARLRELNVTPDAVILNASKPPGWLFEVSRLKDLRNLVTSTQHPIIANEQP